MKQIKSELWKTMHNKFFHFALFIGMYLACYDLVKKIPEELAIFRHDRFIILSNGQKWGTQNWEEATVFIHWMGMGMDYINRVVFYFGYPLLAALPCGWGLVRERKNGYRNLLLTKSKKKKCLSAKIIAGFFSGGIVVCIPVLFTFLIMLLVLPTGNPRPFDTISGINETMLGSRLFFQHPWIFVLANLAYMFLWGGTFALMALAAGSIWKRKTAAVFTPLILCILIELGYEMQLYQTKTECSPFMITHLAPNRGTSGWVIMAELAIFLGGSLLILWRREKKDEGL